MILLVGKVGNRQFLVLKKTPIENECFFVCITYHKIMKTFKKIMKYLALVFVLGLTGVIIYFYQMSAIKSDEKILDAINNPGHNFILQRSEYEGIKYRYVISQDFDVAKPTITFVHGAIGSIDTFATYTNAISSDDANILIFDRPNYGNDFNEGYEHSIAFEGELLNDLNEKYWSDVSNNLFGFSYGGPIVLYAHSLVPYDSVILVSPAIDPENEVVPLPIYFYKWQLTRPLVPKVWVEASKEKLGHVSDLEQYVDLWKTITGNIIHIHGDADIIAPYDNLRFLQDRIDPEYLESITIQGGGHGSLWSESSFIIDIILKQLA